MNIRESLHSRSLSRWWTISLILIWNFVWCFCFSVNQSDHILRNFQFQPKHDFVLILDDQLYGIVVDLWFCLMVCLIGGERATSEQITDFSIQARKYTIHRTQMLDARPKNRCTKPQDHHSKIDHRRSRFQIPLLYTAIKVWSSRTWSLNSYDDNALIDRILLEDRLLKSEVEELKELDEERDKYYKLKCSEMNEFMQNVERFRSENRLQVENLRNRVMEVSMKTLWMWITSQCLIWVK